jgi:hypothetical protein
MFEKYVVVEMMKQDFAMNGDIDMELQRLLFPQL